MEKLESIVAAVLVELNGMPDRGAVTDYIPPLARVPATKLGIAIATADGHVVAAGDADEPFAVQRIAKVFGLTLALGVAGDQLWRRVGREPSGFSFNSIVQLEVEQGIPRNPFINAGAIVVSRHPARPARTA